MCLAREKQFTPIKISLSGTSYCALYSKCHRDVSSKFPVLFTLLELLEVVYAKAKLSVFANQDKLFTVAPVFIESFVRTVR